MKKSLKFFLIFLPLLFTSCAEHQPIINAVDEKDANEIIVFLATKGIKANKVKADTPQGGGVTVILWNITVPPEKSVEAMALLNQFGLPRKQGTTLLKLFEKKGLMTTDREETILYQSGLEEQLTNIILKIDGVLDAKVQISFPTTEELAQPGATKKIKAAVYVKHQGLLEDPNNYLETKVKRLIAGSIDGLDFENVAVITDRARFAELVSTKESELISAQGKEKDYVSIWSIIIAKNSLFRFRAIFFTFIFIIALFGGTLGWMIFKFYPQMIKPIKKEETSENK